MAVTGEAALETARVDRIQGEDQIQGGDSLRLPQTRHGVIPESIQIEILGMTPDKAGITKIGKKAAGTPGGNKYKIPGRDEKGGHRDTF